MKKILFLLSILTAVILSFSVISYATEIETLPGEETTAAEEETTAPEEETTAPEEETTAPEEETTAPEEETTAPEEETTAPEEETTEEEDNRVKVSRCVCDVNGDGKVTAADARIVLRYSVALETMGAVDILFSDADEDGNIRASDARIALRTSVGLDDLLYWEFRIDSELNSTCTEKGKIVAERADGRAMDYTINAAGHKLDEMAYCKGEGVCEVCKETVECPVNHNFISKSSCETSVKCSVCGETKAVTPVHKYKNGKCSACGDFDEKAAYSFMYDYVHKNGYYEKPDYCIFEAYEECDFGLLYDEDLDVLYICCGFMVIDEYGNAVGEVYYYLDFSKDLEDYKLELVAVDASGVLYNVKYDINEAAINMQAPGALYETYYESPYGLSQEEHETLCVSSEAIAISMLVWFDDFASRNDFGFSIHDMGFVKL